MKLEPGLWKATVRGVADVVVLIDDNGYGHHATVIGDSRHSDRSWITDARPLIVLDLGADVGDLAIYLHSIIKHTPKTIGTHGCRIFSAVADQIEAQIEPARIPEPEWGAIVETPIAGDHPRRWVRGDRGWTNLDATGTYLNWTDWDSLIDPVLVREGVES